APRCAQSNRKGTHEPRALLLYGDRAGASYPLARGVRHRGRPGAPGADRAGQPEGERDRHAHRRTGPGRGTREGRGPRAGPRGGAVACGMVPVGDGSGSGGSLRNPASFCNVLGLRGAVGRVPPWPTDAPWGTLHVPGAMARTVADLALMLSVMAGPDRRSPIA